MFNQIIASTLPYMPKKMVWVFSKRYIAGEILEDAVKASKDLNSKNVKVTVDLLGEFITDMKQADKSTNDYLNIIDTFEKDDIDANYSLKPTSFGLLIDKDACYDNIRKIVKKAAGFNNFVRVDMEDSPCVDLEIELFRKLKKEFPKNVGLVFQAYLKRTLDDVKQLNDINSVDNPISYRLCKGIYNESASIAYKKYEEINDSFAEILEYMFVNKIYVGIATHDKPVIDAAYKLIEKYNVPKEMYEFQMLLGVTPELRTKIVDDGHVMRVYVPYGKDWFGYCIRRIKETPKMASHIVKAMFIRG